MPIRSIQRANKEQKENDQSVALVIYGQVRYSMIMVNRQWSIGTSLEVLLDLVHKHGVYSLLYSREYVEDAVQL